MVQNNLKTASIQFGMRLAYTKTIQKPKKMIITKSSKEDQVIHSQLIQTFENIFMSSNTDLLRKILHDKGVFFGNRSKAKTIGYFHNLFFTKEGILEHPHGMSNRGFSCFGDEVLEIRMSSTFDFDETGFPRFPEFGEPPNKTYGERIFRYCFSFKDGLISGIYVPKNCYTKVDRFTDNN